MSATRARTMSRQENRAQRQAQILDAARACVRANGFHGASLSRIATQASMSGGHIYQYYSSKEALMIALCERDFDDFLTHLSKLGSDASSGRPLNVDEISDAFMTLLSHDRSELTLEIIAEAERNPKFMDLVTRVDEQIRNAFRNIIGPHLNALSEREFDEHIETLLVMARGLAVHICIRPKGDFQNLSATFKIVLRAVLEKANVDRGKVSKIDHESV